ncbi:restriction endonuclease subunit S [Vibrio rotiferianus]
MSELPKGWLLLQIDQVTDVVSGGTPKSTNPAYYTEEHDSGIAWVTPADLSGYKAYSISHGRRSITQEGYGACSAKLMPKGAVLFSSRAPVGYVVIAENEISTNQGFKSFVPYVGVDSKYLYFYLKSIRHLAESLATGTTFKELSGKVAKTLPFPLAPLAEQKRIVEKLDEVLAQVDTIKARLDGIPALLKRFRQSVLASAVSGKLTEEWRAINEDQLLLKNNYDAIVEKHFESKKKPDQKRVLKIKEHDWFYKPSNLPVGWVDAHLIDVTSVITCGVAKKPEYQEDGVRFLSAQNSKPFSPNLKGIRYITEKDFKTFTVGAKPQKGDVLYSRVGANFGEACVIPWSFDFAIYVSLTLLKPLRELISGDYLAIFLNSQDGILQSRGGIMGSGIQNLNVESVRKYRLGLPSIIEQNEIVRLVDQYFAFADTIEAQVKKAQARVDNLTQSILAKAFRGELVAQDPNDEPADKLLERIAQARKEAEALAKATKKAEAAKKKVAKSV